MTDRKALIPARSNTILSGIKCFALNASNRRWPVFDEMMPAWQNMDRLMRVLKEFGPADCWMSPRTFGMYRPTANEFRETRLEAGRLATG
jgi:hypothetical protein